MDQKHLHQPLLPLGSPSATTATTNAASPTSYAQSNIKSSNFGIALRLLLIILVGVISTWADHEASKGFMITVSNDMKNTPAGEKFSLFYVSNDEATRLVQGASGFATKILYPNPESTPEKLINQVDIQLANRNISRDHDIVVSAQLGQKNKYMLSISAVIMEFDDFRYRIRKGIQRCMAEILLFNGKSNAPKTLLDGMVEYITISAGFGGPKPVLKWSNISGNCWEHKDPKVVAQFLSYCERENHGFIGRLNQAMRDGWKWDEAMVDRVLGMSATQYCESFYHSVLKNEGLNGPESISSYR